MRLSSPKMPKSCNVRKEFPSIKLNNGMKIPLLGLGTWGVSDFYVKILLEILSLPLEM